MSYSIDLQKISVDQYKEMLKNRDLLPSRKILKENIDEKFSLFTDSGIKNLLELKIYISNPSNHIYFVSSNISKEYLIILKREINSIEPKTAPLKDIPGFDKLIIDSLYSIKIKNTKDYYEYFSNMKDKSAITKLLSISLNQANELFSLTDLVRINGVGLLAAKCFYEAGYISCVSVANADVKEMHNKVLLINSIKNYYQAKLGIKDIQFCIDYAKIIIITET